MVDENGKRLAVAAPSRQRIFPLHLTSIEKLLWTDDRPRYPMAFVLEFAFSGTLDRGAFAASLEEALARHPLLVSLVRPAKRKASCWVPSDGPMPPVDWADEDVPVTFPRGEWIDLRREVGLRIWVRQAPGRARLIAQFHHACCDGIGAYRFLGDLLALYSARTAAHEQIATLHPVELTRLRGRLNGRLDSAMSDGRGRLIRASLAQGYQIIGRGCTPLYPSKARPARQEEAPFPGISSFTFDRAEHRRLRDAAGRLGVTLNDLLLLALFYTMSEWNAAIRPRSPGRRFRIMMPVDLRGQEDYQTPAANIVSYTFLTRRASELRDPRCLLRGIREETALIKHYHTGQRFVDLITSASRCRGLLPSILAAPLTLATAVLSFPGDPSRRFTARFPRSAGRLVCGNLALEEITGVPPMRPRTRATFGINSYRRMLTICVRCDPHLFTLHDTRELLSMYVQRLRRQLDL